MSASFTIFGARDRRVACDLIANAELGMRFSLREAKRSDAQNDKMWAMIGDILKSPPAWFDRSLGPDDVKQVMMSAMFKELRMTRNADNDGYIPLAYRSSQLSVRQMADLIEYIAAWGARNGVVFKPDQDSPATETTERPISLRGVAA